MALSKSSNKKYKNLILSDDLIKKLEEIDRKLNDKINTSKFVRNILTDYVNNYQHPSDVDILSKYTQSELTNYFSCNEAILICAAFNGCMYNVKSLRPKVVIVSTVDDSISLSQYDTLYNVNKDVILSKVSKLTEFQAYVIINQAFKFWKLPDSERQNEKMISEVKKLFFIA